TGFGKTLTFWLPLLVKTEGILIIVTPLNILGEKNAKEAMEKLGLQGLGVNVTAENANDTVFKDIGELKYRVVIVSPELLFTSAIINITFDEAHCIILWGGQDFRPEYKQTHKLRWFIPEKVVYHFVSATLTSDAQAEITRTFNLTESNTREIRLSNDRTNIHLQVIEMVHSMKGMKDLDRVLRIDGETPPPKFMIFCNKRKVCEQVADRIRSRLRPEQREKVQWFHSAMGDEFRERRMEMLKRNELWGIVCTDAAGMGLDVPDVELAIQWGYVESLCTLVQQLGWAVRNPQLEGRGIYFVEGDRFDTNRVAKNERKRKRAEDKRKRAVKGTGG
ncbi:P-loop containing nucleoside triphosphate hydrolase protein, partial [Dendrothele bispora CBS 962.96]